MTNILVKELLQEEKHILQGLHYGCGFDFENDFEIYKFTGNFTLNKILKNYSITENDKAVLLIKNVKYSLNRLYFVNVYQNGFGLCPESRIYYEYSRGIDTFYGKGRFEDARKQPDITVYIIKQDKSKTVKTSYSPEFSENERYKYLDCTCVGYYGAHEINLFPLKGNRKTKVTVDRNIKSSALNNCIDKSGYFVVNKRESLKNRAEQLKASREKEKANIFDYSDIITGNRERFETIKQTVSAMILSSNSWEEITVIDNAVSRLRWLVLDIERTENNLKNKKFPSIERIEKAQTEISKGFEKVENILTGKEEY